MARERSIVEVDRLIAGLAGRQYGVVGRTQLRDLGISDARIEGRIRRAQLHRLHRGVYASGHRHVSTRGRWLAAVLACGPGAVLSHRSAAAAWGILRWSGTPETTRATGWR